MYNLLPAILDNPADDLVRLMHADELINNGQEERGLFIKGQILKDKSGPLSVPTLLFELPSSLWPMLQRSGGKASLGYCSKECNSLIVSWHRGFVDEIEISTDMLYGGACKYCTHEPCWYCGGQRIFKNISKELFSKHPIQKVTLSNRHPRHFNNKHYWTRNVSYNAPQPYEIPYRLYVILVKMYGTNCFNSPKEALAALSNVIIHLGRKDAGIIK